WGRIMNGGAWLTVDGVRIDVLLRDLDVVDPLCARAAAGAFDIDMLLGYVAGVPTYSVLAERAIAVPLFGAPMSPEEYPTRLAQSAPTRWRFNARFSLDYARKHAARGDTLAAVAQVAKAALEEAHARRCEAKQWVLNEKGLLARAGLAALQQRLHALPREPADLSAWVDDMQRLITGTDA
ncbi:MAG: nucleotidyltransferase domain-containing protein, partial [Polyangiales bacterium]